MEIEGEIRMEIKGEIRMEIKGEIRMGIEGDKHKREWAMHGVKRK